ncbi:tyrosine-type recombinase/integrase [Marinomonas fungiae]|uniref:tyrosine-type recombinase/integrase n=1 Tax=Marinomonas fungiae TaxID=1137284 RepID=UPI003A9061A9
MSLTESWLKANHNKARDKLEVKSDRDGLSVRVSPKGKITYQLRYRYDGKQSRVDVGTYPLTSLKDARTKAQEFRAKLEEGHDPRIVKKVGQLEIKQAVTLEPVFEQWYQSYCVKNKKNHAQIKRSFEIYVFPKLGNVPIDQIPLSAWMSILEKLVKDSKPSISARILTNTKQMMKWAIRRQLMQNNVLSDINAKQDLQVEKGVSERALTSEEIKYLWQALDGSRMAPKNKVFVKLCLFYGCRSGEMRIAEKSHFDFERGIWTVPAENHKLGAKTKKPLLRPIIPEIEPLIREAFALSSSDRFVFTNSGDKTVMSRSAPLQLPYNLMQWLRRHKKYEMEHWAMHDLRRTMRTHMAELVQPHVAEIMLGHKLPGEWQTYDKHHYLDEQAEGYRKWWSRINKIIC